MDIKLIIQDYVDYLLPHLDCYEQTLYVYLFRHTCLTGTPEVTIGFKSARRKMGFGVGTKGHGMSEGTCYEKLQSLQKKGCIKIIDSTTSGTKIHVFLPMEISGIIPSNVQSCELNIEEMDFFTIQDNRDAILEREEHKCFYCFRSLNNSNHVIEHVSPRGKGGNGYRNVVAACRNCNNRKNDMLVDDFLRVLYRDGILNADEFAERTKALVCLRAGELKPTIKAYKIKTNQKQLKN